MVSPQSVNQLRNASGYYDELAIVLLATTTSQLAIQN